MRKNTREVIKMTDDLKRLDEIVIGGQVAVIADIRINDHGHYVLRCEIVRAQTRKRNQLVLIIPDKTPVITFE